MRNRRRIVLTALMCACALFTTGCATIPTSGPVVSEPRGIVDEGQSGVTIKVDPPIKGAPPAVIIRGFLTAMASFESDFAAAREYLTQSASRTWHPANSDVLIYDSSASPRITGDQETVSEVYMEGPGIGYLHPDGSFVGWDGPVWQHDFGMVKEDGEWRISSPPDGLALSQYLFTQSFTRIDAYFFPVSGHTLVPDPRYVRAGTWDRTQAARLVLQGPSEWLGAIAGHRSWEDMSLAGDVTLSQGLADVSLLCEGVTPSAEDATQMAIEMAATMRDISGVDRVGLRCDGVRVPLAAPMHDNVVPISVISAYDASPGAGPGALVVSAQGVLASLVAGIMAPLPSDWGTTQRSIHSFAVSSDEIAMVTDEGLVIGPRLAAPGEPVIEGTGFLRPQIDADGNIWAVVCDENGLHITVVRGDDQIDVDTSALGPMTVTGFQVSPDGYRILLVRQIEALEGPRMEVGIALITYDGSAPSAIISWKPVPLTWEGLSVKSIVDLAWMGPSSFLVLASTGTGTPPGVFYTNIYGLDMDDRGMPRASWEPVEMAVHPSTTTPQIIVMDANGTLWSYQDSYQWTRVGTGVSSIAFRE